MIRRIACAVSGGVDSAVSALLLKRKGYDVCGVFMKNWDLRDERGVNCTTDSDRDDAKYICSKLDIPYHDVNFVKEYWNDVFIPMLQDYEDNETPNPDVLCNRRIKFDALLNYVLNTLHVDALATGHYARRTGGADIDTIDTRKECQLLLATDRWKDQTMFLSQIKQVALRRAVFPIGGLLKPQVKQIAREAGLERIASRKESMGICFIEPKEFHKFIEEYIEPREGRFVCQETGKVMGHHKGTHYWTVGQRAKIGGLAAGMFISTMDHNTQDIYVVPGTNHPALYTTSVITGQFHWISQPPCDLATIQSATKDNPYTFKCEFNFQHVNPIVSCITHLHKDGMEIELSRPLRAVTAGQFAVLYDGIQCLGSAKITAPGPSLDELDHREHVPSDIIRKSSS